MSNYRSSGPVCSTLGTGTEDASGYAPPGTNHQVPGSTNGRDLTPQQKELALDIVQLTLDIVGIFEPTPFADGTNALISLGRGDLLGAGLSGISIVPYIGDIAKAGKLPGYAAKIEKAISLARNDANFARYLRPALEKLRGVLNSIPDSLSPRVKQWVDQIRKPIDDFLGSSRSTKQLANLEALTDRLVIAKLGSLKNVTPFVRNNIKTAADFLSSHGIPENRMLQVLSGIDIHKPVEIITAKKGDVFIQYVDKTQGVGSWFIKAGSGTGPLDAGIMHGNREIKRFYVSKDVKLLKSSSASVLDTWTPGRTTSTLGNRGVGTIRSTSTRVVIDADGAIDVSTGVASVKRGQVNQGVTAVGGGTQYYFPQMRKGTNGWEYNRNQYQEFFD